MEPLPPPQPPPPPTFIPFAWVRSITRTHDTQQPLSGLTETCTATLVTPRHSEGCFSLLLIPHARAKLSPLRESDVHLIPVSFHVCLPPSSWAAAPHDLASNKAGQSCRNALVSHHGPHCLHAPSAPVSLQKTPESYVLFSLVTLTNLTTTVVQTTLAVYTFYRSSAAVKPLAQSPVSCLGLAPG